MLSCVPTRTMKSCMLDIAAKSHCSWTSCAWSHDTALPLRKLACTFTK